MENNNDTNNKNVIKIKFNNFLIGIIICAIIVGFIVVVITTSNGQTETASTNSTNEKNAVVKKDYYDFIDTEYYTFNFTEQEFINLLMDGKSYTSMGYMKSAATNDSNTMNYTTRLTGGVQVISITTNPKNYKVQSIKIGFVSNTTLTQEVANQTYGSQLGVILYCMLGPKTNSATKEQNTKEVTDIINEIAEGTASNKGLSFYGVKEARNVECTFTAIK